MSDQITSVQMSAEIKELFGAIAKAKSQYPVIEKTRTAKVTTKTGNYTYDYADLSDIMAAVDPINFKEGLVVIQPPSIVGSMQVINTMIAHTPSGQWISSAYKVGFTDQMREQERGSAMTYARRYALCATLGIVAEDDDDGAAANAVTGRASQSSGSQGGSKSNDEAKAKKKVTEGQIKRLFAIMNGRAQAGWGKEQMEECAIALFGLKESLTELNMVQYDKLIEIMEKNTYQQAVEIIQNWLKEKAKGAVK